MVLLLLLLRLLDDGCCFSDVFVCFLLHGSASVPPYFFSHGWVWLWWLLFRIVMFRLWLWLWKVLVCGYTVSVGRKVVAVHCQKAAVALNSSSYDAYAAP